MPDTASGQALELDPAYAQFRDQSRFWIQRVAVPMLMVIGLFGNLITVIIMTRRRMRSTTNLYLAALALVDMLYLVLTFLLGLSHYPNMASYEYYAYWKLRPFLIMLTDACSNTSVWLTVSFTIERYIAVKYPMKGKVWCTESRAKKLIVSVFVFAILFASPVPFEWKVIEKRVAVPLKGYREQAAASNNYIDTELALPISTSTSATPEQSTLLMVTDGEQSSGDSMRGPNDRNLEVNSVRSSVETYILALDYSDFGRNETYKTIYYWSTAVIFYFIPLFSLMLFNGFLIKSVHQSRRERTELTRRVAPTSAANQNQLLAESKKNQIVDSPINNSSTTVLSSTGTSLGYVDHVSTKTNEYCSLVERNDGWTRQNQNQLDLRAKTKRPSRHDPQADNGIRACGGRRQTQTMVVGGDCSGGQPHSKMDTSEPNSPISSSQVSTKFEPNGSSFREPSTQDPHDYNDSRNFEPSVQIRCDNPDPSVDSSVGFGASMQTNDYSRQAQFDDRSKHESPGSEAKVDKLQPSRYLVLNRKPISNGAQHPQAVVQTSTQERRITIMLIAVVILFLVCQIPSAAMLLYTSVREIEANTNEHALVLAFGNIFNFLMAVNAAGNFILYSFLSKKYRRTFMILFCGCFKSKLGGKHNKSQFLSGRYNSTSRTMGRPSVRMGRDTLV